MAAQAKEFKEWLGLQISLHLGFDIPEIVDHVAGLAEEDAVEYISPYISAPEFVAELRRRVRLLRGSGGGSHSGTGVSAAATEPSARPAAAATSGGGGRGASANQSSSRQPAAAQQPPQPARRHEPPAQAQPPASAAAAGSAKGAPPSKAGSNAAAASTSTGAGGGGGGGGRARLVDSAAAAVSATSQKSGSSGARGSSGGGGGKPLKASSSEFRPGDAAAGSSAAAAGSHTTTTTATTAAAAAALSAAATAAVAQAPRRRTCGCAALEHRLLCNCTGCGRVHCEAEAGEECLFCGGRLQDVSNAPISALRAAEARQRAAGADAAKVRDAIAGLTGGGGSGGGSTASSLSPPPPSGGPGAAALATTAGATTAAAAPAAPPSAADAALSTAVAAKDKLLHFQATHAARTRVLDDGADYFSDAQSPWLNPQERAAALAADKVRAAAVARAGGGPSRGAVSIALDFAGRSVVVRDEGHEAQQAQLAALRAAALGPPATTAAAPPPVVATTAAATTSLPPAPAVGGLGTGTFTNATLSGRAAEVYAYILDEARSAREGGGGRRQRGAAASGHAHAAASGRVQHTYEPGAVPGGGAGGAPLADVVDDIRSDVACG